MKKVLIIVAGLFGAALLTTSHYFLRRNTGIRNGHRDARG